MPSETESLMFRQLDNVARDSDVEKFEASRFWWSTCGRDLARMMSVAEYPEEAQRQFLGFFRDTITPQLGRRPDSTSGQSGGKHILE
ncbi:hypothetical protein RRF57_001710 [Xylaria bambusicola]|uniref:Uncharacterized protein n=1 Tax=Xylaria bambusicola TaxID=326684 RepID=A0AAN7UHF0_9PEZI